MGWVAIPDDVYADPALARVGPRAAWLWTCARAYAGQRATDGAIPSIVLRLAGASAADAKALVSAGLWTEAADGWTDPRFLDDNASSAEREASRAWERERKARRRAIARGYDPSPTGTATWNPTGVPAGVPVGVRHTQVQVQEQESPPLVPPSGGRATLPGVEVPKVKRPKAAKGPMPPDYQPADDIIALASSLGVDLARETAACRDYFAAHGKPMADWHATLRGWVRRAPTFARTGTRPRADLLIQTSTADWDAEYARAEAIAGAR